MDSRARLTDALGAAYRVQHELGGGGMSHVFVADEVALGRRVVIKMLSPELASDISVDRFRREIALAARLQHPYIVPLLAAGDADGTPWYTMPLVTGETLRERLARAPIPTHEAARIIRDIASALAYAHDQGVVHRDIKPENVLLTDGGALVTDFGVAKALAASNRSAELPLTTVGLAVGTPAYMAPEQALGDPGSDHRIDLYALGVVAYEMLTGHHPFGERTPQGLLAAHVSEQPADLRHTHPGIPTELSETVMRCLEKDPAQRLSSAREATAAAERTAHAVPRAASAEPSRRRPLRTALSLATLAAILGLAAVYAARSAGNDRSTRIAVLPFTDLTGDSALTRIGESAAHTLTSGISQVEAGRAVHTLAVMAALAAATATDDLVQLVARRTGATLVVHGNVTRAEDSVRIEATLSDSRRARVLRTFGPFSGPLHDPTPALIELRDRLAGALAMSGVQRASLASTAAPLFPSQQAFMEGIERVVRGLPGASDFFARAVELDSTFVQAYLYLTQSYIAARDFDRIGSLVARLDAMRGSLSRSDRLRVDLLAALQSQDAARVERLLSQLIAIDSLPGEIFQRAALQLRTLRASEAVEGLRAVDDVLSRNGWTFVATEIAVAQHLLGNDAAAVQRLELARRTWPAERSLLGNLLMALAGRGDGPRAIALADTMLATWTAEPTFVGDVLIAASEFEAHGTPQLAAALTRRLRSAVDRESSGVPDTVLVPYVLSYLVDGTGDSAQLLRPRLLANPTTPSRTALAGILAAQAGDHADALECDSVLATLDEPVALYLRGALRAYLGDDDLALQLLRQSVPRGLNLRYTHSTTWYRPLRGLPDFRDVVRVR